MANNKKLTPQENEYLNLLNGISEEEKNNFVDLISNALNITDLPDNVPKDWVIKSLLNTGRVGVYKINDNVLWLPAKPNGEKNEMGEPLKYLLETSNGKSFTVSKDSSNLLAIIRLRPSARSLSTWLQLQADNLAFIQMAKKTNLIATQTNQVYECGDNNTVIELKSVFEKRSLGMPAIFERKTGIEDCVKNIGSNVPFIADKLNEIYKQDKNEVLNRLGILTSNSDKKERVQVGEITAQVGEVIDSIYTFIDTFNTDAKRWGIPQRMILNSVVEDYYSLDNTEEQNENDNVEFNSNDN